VSSTSAQARDILEALRRPVGRLAGERISTTGQAFKTLASCAMVNGSTAVEQL
jgi:hypothetical protein